MRKPDKKLAWIAVAAAAAIGGAFLIGPKEGKPLKAAQAAPELSLPDIEGRMTKLSSFKGKVVLLDFWATWCEPCLEELPDLVRLHESRKDSGFTMLGVAMDAEGVAVVRPFVRQNKIPYPIVVSGGDLPPGYPIPGFPTAFLIDKNGVIVRRYLGPKAYDELERDVAEALAR